MAFSARVRSFGSGYSRPAVFFGIPRLRVRFATGAENVYLCEFDLFARDMFLIVASFSRLLEAGYSFVNFCHIIDEWINDLYLNGFW